jgi:hypothetical protein
MALWSEASGKLNGSMTTGKRDEKGRGDAGKEQGRKGGNREILVSLCLRDSVVKIFLAVRAIFGRR